MQPQWLIQMPPSPHSLIQKWHWSVEEVNHHVHMSLEPIAYQFFKKILNLTLWTQQISEYSKPKLLPHIISEREKSSLAVESGIRFGSFFL